MLRKKHASDQYCFNVSFPEGMRERIKVAAKESYRSMNSEIVARLQMSFECCDLANQTDAPCSARERMMPKAMIPKVPINTVPIPCSQCGAACSQPVIHPGTIIRAFVQCQECAQKEQQNEPTHHA